MKHLWISLALLVAASPVWAQEGLSTGAKDDSVTVAGKEITVSAKGLDVRSVLFDLFSQTGHNFIIDDGVRHVLYLNLAKVEFQEAFHVILKQCDLGYEVKGEIYYIGKNRPKSFTQAKPKTTTPPVIPPPLGGAKPDPVKAPETDKASEGAKTSASGQLSAADLQKRLTTRMAMADLRDVFKEFGKQTGITIEVAESVPFYKIDAFLLDTSLKYALDVVTEATKLKYTLTDKKTIRIEPVKA